jgi:hypothetical protein
MKSITSPLISALPAAAKQRDTKFCGSFEYDSKNLFVPNFNYIIVKKLISSMVLIFFLSLFHQDILQVV